MEIIEKGTNFGVRFLESPTLERGLSSSAKQDISHSVEVAKQPP